MLLIAENKLFPEQIEAKLASKFQNRFFIAETG